ncbi:MAG: hypothetical protein IJ518_07490 [Clostridia bacterium]|nr:hypothetical protein [Clostridia bacterium]
MKIRNMLACVVCIALLASLSLSAAPNIDWGGMGGGLTEDDPSLEEPVDTGELRLMASSGTARLYYNDVTTEVVLENTQGVRFSSAVTSDYAGTKPEAEENMRELFSFLVYNKQTRTTQSYSSADSNVTLTLQTVDGGFDVKAEKESLSFTISFRLNDSGLTVSIPQSSVTEGEECLATLTLMPFFGACNTKEDGYIFYPDGSGALYTFKDKPKMARSAVTKLIYSDAVNELDDYMDDREHNILPLTLPVYGIKRGENALFAQVKAGAADTSLTLAPHGYIYDLARVYPTFNYRYSYFETAVAGSEMLLFNETAVKTDFSVSYSILSGEDASYIGMARLMQKELFGDSEKTAAPNLSVDLLMTTQKSLLLWNVSRAVTTFDQAGDFLKTLHNDGIDNVRLNLLGWQAGGYNNYPSHLPVAGSAGGKNGLKALTALAAENGSQIYLQDNFAEADFAGSGYSIRRDAAYNMQKKVLADTLQTKLLLDIGRGLTTFKKNVQKLADTGIAGYSFDLFGSLVYDSIATGRELRRQAYTEKVNEYLALSSQQFGSNAVDGANYYALQSAGFLYNLPAGSSGEFIYDEDVPFLQIVLHGYRPYSGRTFGNFSNSVEEAALHWLEYGYVPSFVLGHQSPSTLKDTMSEGFFYSRIEDWSATIAEIYTDFLPTYEQIKSQAITGYVKDGDTRVVTYENGRKLYLNYSKEPAVVDGVTIEALSYVLQ